MLLDCLQAHRSILGNRVEEEAFVQIQFELLIKTESS